MVDRIEAVPFDPNNREEVARLIEASDQIGYQAWTDGNGVEHFTAINPPLQARFEAALWKLRWGPQKQ